MKNIKRFLAIILTGVLLFTFASCGKEKSCSEEIGADRFLKTDWGMSFEETLKALNLKENDVELKQYTVNTDTSNKQSYKVKKKLKINGLEGEVTLMFTDTVKDLFNSEKDITLHNEDSKVGLFRVQVLFNEKDDETVYKAFEKELGENKQSINIDGKNMGYYVDKGNIEKLKGTEIYDKFVDIFKDSPYSPDKEKDLKVFSLRVEKFNQETAPKENVTHGIRYDAGLVSVINNLDK